MNNCQPVTLQWEQYGEDDKLYAGAGELTYIIERVGSKYRLCVSYHTTDPAMLGYFSSIGEAKRRASFDFRQQFEDMTETSL